jgi:4-amino-4-deoxy-L-arabinose transferase-like glycosyltransferase
MFKFGLKNLMDVRNIHLFIALSGIVFSLIFSLVVFPRIQDSFSLCIDPDKNGDLSTNIYLGNGFKYSDSNSPAVDRGPVYPYLVSSLFKIFGTSNYRVVQIFQAILFGLTGIIIYNIVINISTKKAAVLSEIIYFVHPMFIWYTSRVWIETTHTFLIATTAFLLVKVYKSLNAWWTIVLGIVVGFTILTKSILLLFPILLIPLFSLKWKKEGIKYAFVAIFIAYLIVLPWTLRNYFLTRDYIPVHTSLGLNLIQGDVLAENWLKHPLSNMDSWFVGDARMKEILKETGATPQDSRGDKILKEYSIRQNYKKPFHIFWRTIVNMVTFWYLSESPTKSIILAMVQLPFLLIFLYSFKKLLNRYTLMKPILWLIVYYTILHSLIIGWARYSVPIIPLIILSVVVYSVELRKRYTSALNET